jgi:hypothetical protein
LSTLGVLGVLINHGEQGFTARSQLVPTRRAPRLRTTDAARTAGCIPALSCRARGAPTPAAETLALARHLIGYLTVGLLAAVVTTLLPADEIPHLLGGAGG